MTESPTPAVFHLIDLTEWMAGGRTRCCDIPVTDLPDTDECGSTFALREPGFRRCEGGAK